ncbi:Histone acetyltransferase kat2b [Perkinsus chesapeaki]|uniref:Histone acetyltransferase kat2b n=1 Tax=Perkinsus chesapeaki TaxID=330153 RepID=A0A7J6MU44_PERCH|nr:Histone acetyltransferase kat2b [Perkinsus chesapeaki]
MKVTPGRATEASEGSEGSSHDAYETPLSSTPADLGITFELVSHANATEEKMLKLLVVKNIFSRQLPRMPKAYLSRLMFDSKHETMVMIRGDSILGGCCFRQFQTHFIEIAFLAVRSFHQIQGNGTRLMNHMKEYAKSIGVHYFLTYADNHAIGYFKRQGFTKHLSFPKAQWNGFIKDYDGGSLMGCKLFENINYLDLGPCLEELAQKVWDDLMYSRLPEEAFEGLDFGDGKAKGIRHLWALSGDPSSDPMAIPGVMECGWTPELDEVHQNSRQSTLQGQMSSIIAAVSKKPYAWPFREPVRIKEAPNYHDIIKFPMDLQTMKNKCDTGQYRTREEFIEDIDLMRDNCVTYNGRDSDYTKRANEVHEYVVSRARSLACYIHEASIRSAQASQATTPESSEEENGLT